MGLHHSTHCSIARMETSGFGASNQTSKKARDTVSRDAHSHYSHLGLSKNWLQPTKETDWEKSRKVASAT